MTHQQFNERGYLVDRASAVIGREVIPVVYKFDVHLKGKDTTDRSATVKSYFKNDEFGWSQEFAMEIERIGKVIVFDPATPLAGYVHSVIAAECSNLFLTVFIEPLPNEQLQFRPKPSDSWRSGLGRRAPESYGNPNSDWASATRKLRDEKREEDHKITEQDQLERMMRSRKLM